MYKKMDLSEATQGCIFHQDGDVLRLSDNITRIDFEFNLSQFQLKNLYSKEHLNIEKERLSKCIKALLLDVPTLTQIVITKKITIANIANLLVGKVNRVQLKVLLSKKLLRFLIQTSLFNEASRSNFKKQIIELSYGRQFTKDSDYQFTHVIINLIKLYEFLDLITEDIELINQILTDNKTLKQLFEVEKDFKTKDILWQH